MPACVTQNRSHPTSVCWPAPILRVIPALGVAKRSQVAEMSELPLRILMQRPAPAFVISHAVRHMTTGRPTGAPLQRSVPGFGVYGVAFSSDGKLLVIGAGDGTVRAWNPATRQPVGAPIQTGA